MTDTVTNTPSTDTALGTSTDTAVTADPNSVTPATDTAQNTDSTDSKPDAAKVEGAPENYADFKIADGLSIDETALTEFKAFAKEMNWSQEQAQKIVDFQNKLELQRTEQGQKQWEAVVEAWRNAAKTDKEVGGPQFKEQVALADKALQKYGTPELRQLFNDTYVGDHPEMIRVFARIGKAMSEDTISTGGNAASSVPIEQKLFPSMSTQK